MTKMIRISSVLGLLLLSFTIALGGQTEPDVVIKDVDPEEEVVALSVTEAGSMAGWVLLSLGDDGPSDVDQIYRFPAVCEVNADTEITLHSGDAADDLTNRDDVCSNGPVVNLYWDSFTDRNVWNNDGDTACLLNRDRKLVDQKAVGNGTSDCLSDYSDV